jgi:hypothetical protein
MIQFVTILDIGSEIDMPYYYHNEIWTPLKYFGIQFFIDENGHKWIKFGSRHRRPLFKQSRTDTFEDGQ